MLRCCYHWLSILNSKSNYQVNRNDLVHSLTKLSSCGLNVVTLMCPHSNVGYKCNSNNNDSNSQNDSQYSLKLQDIYNL